jgi:hypothetical protein
MSIRVSARTHALSGTFVLALLIAACSSQSLQRSLRGSGGSDAGSDFGIGASDTGTTGVFMIPGDPEKGAFVQGTSSATFDGVRIEAKIVVQNVTPGAEQHVCVIVELPTASDVWVKEVDATLSGGSHHVQPGHFRHRHYGRDVLHVGLLLRSLTAADCALRTATGVVSRTNRVKSGIWYPRWTRFELGLGLELGIRDDASPEMRALAARIRSLCAQGTMRT